MKKLMLSALIVLSSCSANQKREKELELKVQELELRILELQEKKSGNTDAKEGFGNAHITGSGVHFRESFTTKSKKIGKFQKNEEVLIHKKEITKHTNEAIIKEQIEFKNEKNTYKLSRGKEVKILLRDADNFKIQFLHPTYGKMETVVDQSKLKVLGKDTWYQVERKNGKIGWVYGSYVKQK